MQQEEIRLAQWILISPLIFKTGLSLSICWLQANDKLGLSCNSHRSLPLPEIIYMSVLFVTLAVLVGFVAITQSSSRYMGQMFDNDSNESVIGMRVFYCGVALAVTLAGCGFFVSVVTLLQ